MMVPLGRLRCFCRVVVGSTSGCEFFGKWLFSYGLSRGLPIAIALFDPIGWSRPTNPQQPPPLWRPGAPETATRPKCLTRSRTCNRSINADVGHLEEPSRFRAFLRDFVTLTTYSFEIHPSSSSRHLRHQRRAPISSLVSRPSPLSLLGLIAPSTT